MGNKPWTAEEVDIFREMSSRGESATAIARRVGRTRNAVIGRWRRDKPPPSSLLTPEPAPVKPPARVSLYAPSMSLCQWPLGDPRDCDFHFCGEPTSEPPYCKYHYSIAHTRERS